ncbi:unnamed protein product [Arabis nemorensis]|uniref:Uncharacterized protein n=1 Tax=Arabis nemorensis TaxID=586526 RepID=A0A565AX40_9BRAS|nr:unnamed protein product [Arabis nemorensis]
MTKRRAQREQEESGSSEMMNSLHWSRRERGGEGIDPSLGQEGFKAQSKWRSRWNRGGASASETRKGRCWSHHDVFGKEPRLCLRGGGDEDDGWRFSVGYGVSIVVP